MKTSATDYEAVVIGAGVGGTCAALALAQRGVRTLLLDSHAPGRPKVCGEFLSPESRETFQRLEVWTSILEAGARAVTRGRVVTSHRLSGALPLPGTGRALSRHTLDTLLWSAAEHAGAETRAKTRVDSVEQDAHGHFLLKTSTGELTSRFVLSAAGRNARLGNSEPKRAQRESRRFLGLKTHLRDVTVPPGEVQLYPFPGGYCGLVTVEDGTVNACMLVDYAHARGLAPEQVWDKVRHMNHALLCVTEGAEPVFPWVGTGNVTFGKLHPVRGGLICAGDAAGFIHPLTGDGMAMAARSGELAGERVATAIKAHQSNEFVAQNYASSWHEEFRTRLRWASVLQPLLTTPWLTGPSMRLFDWLPELRQLAVARTRGA